MRALSRAFWFTIAAIFVLEAWLWDRLGPIVHRLVALLPIKPLRLWLEKIIAAMPPWAALALFVPPLLVLEPLKIAALWLFAQGRIIAGIAVFAVAKVVGLGLLAWLFDLTRDKLLSMAWFAHGHALVLRGLSWARAMVAPFREKIASLIWLLRRERRSRFFKHLSRLRQKARAAG
ncbi:MAG: hypothetical protein ACOVN4_10820 [Bosea sp. (in: a-proteobacteria)]|jgi:hypothetical protein